MIQTAVRFGLGAAAMAAGTVTQWFWELVERGEAVRPADPGLAAAIGRTVTIAAPTAVGAAIGTALDTGLRTGERTAHVASSTVDELARLLGTLLHRAGLPSEGDLQQIARRLDTVDATLSAIAADRRHALPGAQSSNRENP